MRRKNTAIIAELETGLAALRKRRRQLSWVNVLELNRIFRRLRSRTDWVKVREDRLAVEQEILEIMWRMKHILRGKGSRAPAPAWMKAGYLKQQGQAKKTYLKGFFDQMQARSELQKAVQALLKKPWQYYRSRYARWRILLAREQKAQHQAVGGMQELRNLLAVVKGLLVMIDLK